MAAGDIIVVHENIFGVKGNYYDGGDDYVQHNAHAAARVTANDTVGTYTAKIYLNDLTGTYCILCAGDDSAIEFIELSVEAGLLTARCTDAGVVQFVTQADAIEFEAKRWYHVSVVQAADGGGVKLYVDGVLIASTNDDTTDLDEWYNNLDLTDTFRIGAANKVGDASVTDDFNGAIGQVKYWSLALTTPEIKIEANANLSHGTARQIILDAALQLNVTYENDGITDSGLGADNGTLVNNAIYGGVISDWSYTLNENVTGHAAEFINTVDGGGGKLLTLIKRGD